MYLCCLNGWMLSGTSLAAGASATLWRNADFFFFFSLSSKKYIFLGFYKPFLESGSWHNKKSPVQMTLFLFLRRDYPWKGFLFGRHTFHTCTACISTCSQTGLWFCSPAFTLSGSCNGSSVCYQLVKFLWAHKVHFMISLQDKGGRGDGLSWRVYLLKWKEYWDIIVKKGKCLPIERNLLYETQKTLHPVTANFAVSFHRRCAGFVYSQMMTFPSVPLGREHNCSDFQCFTVAAEVCFSFEQVFRYYVVSAYHSEICFLCFVNTRCLIIPCYSFCSVMLSVFLIGWLK